MHAFLIDYEWCTGCHSCEVACQVFNGFPPEEFGIKLCEVGPWPYGDEAWQYAYVPVATDQCDQCPTRVSAGKLPTCVQHCQAQCLQYGGLEEMQSLLSKKPKQIIQVID